MYVCSFGRCSWDHIFIHNYRIISVSGGVYVRIYWDLHVLMEFNSHSIKNSDLRISCNNDSYSCFSRDCGGNIFLVLDSGSRWKLHINRRL